MRETFRVMGERLSIYWTGFFTGIGGMGYLFHYGALHIGWQTIGWVGGVLAVVYFLDKKNKPQEDHRPTIPDDLKVGDMITYRNQFIDGEIWNSKLTVEHVQKMPNGDMGYRIRGETLVEFTDGGNSSLPSRGWMYSGTKFDELKIERKGVN